MDLTALRRRSVLVVLVTTTFALRPALVEAVQYHINITYSGGGTVPPAAYETPSQDSEDPSIRIKYAGTYWVFSNRTGGIETGDIGFIEADIQEGHTGDLTIHVERPDSSHAPGAVNVARIDLRDLNCTTCYSYLDGTTTGSITGPVDAYGVAMTIGGDVSGELTCYEPTIDITGYLAATGLIRVRHNTEGGITLRGNTSDGQGGVHPAYREDLRHRGRGRCPDGDAAGLLGRVDNRSERRWIVSWGDNHEPAQEGQPGPAV